MSAITPAASAAAVNLIGSLGGHALRVLHDPGFQGVAKREGWQFVVKVAAEARDAWLRT